MNEEEKDAARRQIEHLGREYLRPQVSHGRRHPMEDGFWEWRYALDQLRLADEVLQFLNRTDRDAYATLANVDQTLDNAHEGLVRAQSELRAIGYLDLLDAHIDTVMRGLDAEGLPDEETEILEMLGFPHLASTVGVETDLFAAEWRHDASRALAAAHEYRQNPASGTLAGAIRHVDQHRQERREAARRQPEKATAQTPADVVEPRKSRKWWKGLGQIIEGASLATVDAGLAIGALKFPVSPETRTYGSIISVGAGFGKIMCGVGDLWGE